MHLRNQGPIFVPDAHAPELEKLSKAALMDMVWDMATQLTGGDSLANADIMHQVRQTAEVVIRYRKQERVSRGR